MFLFDTSRSHLQQLELPLFREKNCTVWVKRDDLIDPEVSGNKWRKLKYYIEKALVQKKYGIVTLGGAFSNHLLATAAACNKTGLRAIGLVRGEELSEESNPNLKRCKELGMELYFLSRLDYAERHQEWFKDQIQEDYPNFLFVQEGGAGYHGLIGCQELMEELPETVTDVFVAQGTTTTSCGILLGCNPKQKIHVVPALKGFDALAEMRPLLYQFCMDNELVSEYLQQVVVHPDHHFGGYAKTTPELLEFIETCKTAFDLPLDRVYTAKAFHALIDWVKTSPDANGAEVVFVHTGGLMNG